MQSDEEGSEEDMDVGFEVQNSSDQDIPAGSDEALNSQTRPNRKPGSNMVMES